jgi:hypothetical protein
MIACSRVTGVILVASARIELLHIILDMIIDRHVILQGGAYRAVSVVLISCALRVHREVKTGTNACNFG